MSDLNKLLIVVHEDVLPPDETTPLSPEYESLNDKGDNIAFLKIYPLLAKSPHTPCAMVILPQNPSKYSLLVCQRLTEVERLQKWNVINF
jgi:hypothetical protein